MAPSVPGGECVGMTPPSLTARLCSAILGLVLAVAPAGAIGATSKLPTLLKGLRPMQVRIVRSAELGCEPNCAEWISAEGDIVDATPGQFQKVIASIGARKLPVFINSGGGSIEAAMAIGRLLRARALDVSVTHTDLIVCATAKQNCAAGAVGNNVKAIRGLPNSYSAYCASACTLVLAAGVERLASPWSHVGVHSIVVFQTQYRVRRTYRVTTRQRPGGGLVTHRTLLREQTIGATTTEVEVNDGTYQPMEAYLRQMGIADALVPLMEATPNSSIHWMTRAEQDTTKLVTRQESGEALLNLVDVPPLSAADAAASVPGRGSANAIVPTFYQGRQVQLVFSASYDKTNDRVGLTVSMQQNGELLRNQGLFATFGLGGDRKAYGFGADSEKPFAPLSASVPPAEICPLRQTGALQVSLHPADLSAKQTVPLGETWPVTITVAFARGLGDVLAEACATQTAAWH